MKRILLIILSLFTYQSYAADDVHFDGKVRIWVGYAVLVDAKKTDTIKTLIDRFYNQRNSHNRMELSPILRWNYFSKEMVHLDMDQTVESANLLINENRNISVVINEYHFIDITVRTMTGKSFAAKWKLFDKAGRLGYKIINDDKLLDIQAGFKLNFIHNRAGKLNDDICADQVPGLLEDPNLTVIVEPLQR